MYYVIITSLSRDRPHRESMRGSVAGIGLGEGGVLLQCDVRRL